MHRDELVTRGRRQITSESAARFQLFIIIALSGLSALLASATALHVGLFSMAVRYALSGVWGYLAFLLLVRVWIAWKRGHIDMDRDTGVDTLDLVDWPRARSVPSSAFEGGRRGGGGASGNGTRRHLCPAAATPHRVEEAGESTSTAMRCGR